MATVLESLAIPRASALPKPSFVSASSSSSSSICSFNRKSIALPQAKGLKVGFFTATRSGGSVAIRRPIGGSSRIVCEAQDTAVDVPGVTDATWQSLVLESEAPVLVEFWAPWCGPCRMIHPVIGELAKQYAGKLKCCKVNTDDSPAIATKYGIRSIPTVIIFKNGEKKDAIIGAVQKSILINSIEKFL